jgi:hypothetical protein
MGWKVRDLNPGWDKTFLSSLKGQTGSEAHTVFF